MIRKHCIICTFVNSFYKSIYFSTLFLFQVKTALMSLFGTRCPKQITNPTASKEHYNFEGSCSVCDDLRGSRVTDVEAFCGKGSILNPTYLYKNDNNGLALNQKMKTVRNNYRVIKLYFIIFFQHYHII